ncbi:MAG: response regulator transcription factor [Proteobacteria bacterium]|nr:response regulator transcription factor [Pseudomonadota bacterium]MBU4297308.1 response regulator transcription factor [Pseudomonadota bacterium]MCG2747742.1 response regulator transcription factor [Desulfobulbaceae bacterium]
MKKRILIIEDDRHIAEGLQLNLVMQGYEVEVAADGPSGLQQWQEWRPHLIVLDIMLPGIDGLDVLQNIRLEDERLPVLILSAKAMAEDKIKGLALGVDDYLTKPFHLEEFLLRVKRLLTRYAWENNDDKERDLAAIGPTYIFGNNSINFTTHTAQCASGTITLTDIEVKLLKLFIVNRGKPLSRRQLIEMVWGYEGDIQTRTVDNFIVRFRKYFEEDPKKPVFFKTRRSVGYVFDH